MIFFAMSIFLKGKIAPVLGLPLWDSFLFASVLANLHCLGSSLMFSNIVYMFSPFFLISSELRLDLDSINIW
jgi:hypothetical protein